MRKGIPTMSDIKKLVSLENLTSYDTLIKKYISDADIAVDARSIKYIRLNGDNIEFYKKASPLVTDTPDYTVAISSSDVEQLLEDVAEIQDTLAGYSSSNTVASAIATAKSGAESYADGIVKDLADGAVAANTTAINAINNTETGILAQATAKVTALENGQVKTNKEAIEAINDSTTGIEAVAKKYTDDEIDKVEAVIGTVADDTTVVAMIADAKKAGTDANAALESYKTTNDAAVKAAKDAADAAQGDVDALDGVVGDMSAVKTTAKTVAGAVDELKDAIDNAAEAGEVTITTASTPTDGYLKTYVFTQGATEIGKIDIPKDLVVTGGEVVVDPEGQPKGTYIKLTIANQEAPIYINVKDLVDVYTAAKGATQVQLAVDGFELSATLVAGGVGTTELADGAITTAKIADKNITKDKLSDAVQASLNAADAAAGAITAAIEALDSTKSQTAGADGLALEIVETDGIITSISGSIAANTYDAFGAAKTVQDDLDNYKYTVATSTEINDLFKEEESAPQA